MFSYSGELFELRENEIAFEEVCQKLKNPSFQSPWTLCFPAEKKVQNTNDCEIQELCLSEKEISSILSITNKKSELVSSLNDSKNVIKNEIEEYYEEQLLLLKTSLISVQDSHEVEYLKGIEFIGSLSLSQGISVSILDMGIREVQKLPQTNQWIVKDKKPLVPKFCESLIDAFHTETSVALFLTAILNFKKPLGITVAAIIVNCIVFPKILSLASSNCRNLSLAILNFSTIYPKVTIDELLIPCLKRKYLEAPLMEVLIKISKVTLPEEYVSYCIKNILNEPLSTENTFVILHNLIERKVPYENNLHNSLAFTVENWVPTSSKNIKFTKLLINILSAYGDQLTDQQMKIYSNAIEVNSTIMKKAAENVLKMIKN